MSERGQALVLEVRIRGCSRARSIIQRIALGGHGCASATREVGNESAVSQAALVLLRLRGGCALVALFYAGGLGGDGGALPGHAIDAEEVLDLLAGGVVDLGVGAHGLASEAALLTRVRHAGVGVGRKARHGR